MGDDARRFSDLRAFSVLYTASENEADPKIGS